MPLRLRSAGGGSVLLSSPAAQSTDVAMEVPAYDGAKLLTNKTPGVVLQVINASLTGSVSTTSSTRSNTGLSATITPSSSTSKILALVNIAGNNKNGGTSSGSYASFWLMRDSTDIIKFEGEAGYTGNTGVNSAGACSTSFLDSPGTLSAVTYKVQFNNPANAGNVSFSNSSSTSTITLMEIAA